MTGASLPIFLASALGAASIGVLYSLHHLRQRAPRRPVATLLFWSHAVRPQQSRVLISRRFTRPRTFLLLAAILLLLAASIAADRWGTTGRVPVDVVVVDIGMETAATDAGGRPLLRRMTESAASDFAGASAGPALVAAGPQPVLIVREGEPAALAGRCLVELSPQVGASAASLGLLMADGILGDRDGRIHWYTSQGEIPAGLPGRVASRVVLHSSRAPEQAAIVGVTFEPAADDGARGRVRVRVVGNATQAMPSAVAVRRQNAPAISLPITTTAREQTAIVDDVAADGERVTFALQSARGASAAHKAFLTLPERRPVTFRFDDAVPRALKLALLTHGIEADEASRTIDIFVAESGTPVPPSAKAVIAVVNAGAGIASGKPLVVMDLPVTRGINLEHATAIEGPAISGSGSPLISAGDAVAAAVNLTAAQPTLTISRGLIAPAADLPKHAAFPLLMGRLCDALIGRAATPAVVSQSRAAIDPLWLGPADAPASEAIPIADTPADPINRSPATTIDRLPPWPARWTNVVLFAATALLAVESLLRTAKKIV